MILLKVKPEENVTLNISEEKSVNLKAEAVRTVEVPGGCTNDHSELINRELPDQHPMSAITGLEEALEGKQPSGTYLTSETDPTVPMWAKQKTKPSYTASEVGALPSTTKIPSKTSDLTNDSGFITEFTEKDPTVPAWAKEPTKPSYTAQEVGADQSGAAASAQKAAQEYTDRQIAAIPTPDVSGQINTHNTATDAHNDIRLLISGLTERLNALANSDDTTLDQMAEVVAYIKDNRELIEQVTTEKVSVSDIIDNLATNVSDKPLSAAQGVALKKLIDAIVIPTKVSAFDNDKGYLTEHQDLSDYAKKTELPTVPTKVSVFQNDAGYLTQHQDLSAYSKTTDMLKLVYPVGAIYMSAVATSPATLFGFGTWEQIKDRFLLSAGSSYAAGATGGEATHTLTVDEIPSHGHDIRNRDGTGSNGLCATTATSGSDGNSWCFEDHPYDRTENSSGNFGAANTGGGKAHNNMPPYLAVYVWKRTA